jgi:hypothetical protein
MLVVMLPRGFKHLLPFVLAVIVSSVWSSAFGTAVASNRGWPAFKATYQLRAGRGPNPHTRTFRLSYEGPKDWTIEILADSQLRDEDLTVSTFDGTKETITWGNGTVDELPIDELSPIHHFIEPCGVFDVWLCPVNSRSELLTAGEWQPIGSQGDIKRTIPYRYTCADIRLLECQPFQSVNVVETTVRDRHGLPLSFSEDVDGVIVSEATAVAVAVGP